MVSFFFFFPLPKYYPRGHVLERKDRSQTLKIHSSSSCTVCSVACSGRPLTDLDFCVLSLPRRFCPVGVRSVFVRRALPFALAAAAFGEWKGALLTVLVSFSRKTTGSRWKRCVPWLLGCLASRPLSHPLVPSSAHRASILQGALHCPLIY